MSSRKEEERNEKIIRGLMKLPPNRRCINCNGLGPQYVCTNFWTFVCITCSGIHREFTHRVKSVSMAKFTSQEVEELQRGGNQRAREMFLKDWDTQRQRLPDGSNVDKVREFIKNVYVDRRYAGGRTSDKPPRDMQNHKNHEDDNRRASSYHSYSQSPPYEHQYEDRRYGKQTGMLTRKPGSDRGHYESKISSLVYSPGRLGEQMYEDRFANEGSGTRISDYSVSSTGDPFRSDLQSPNFQKDVGFSSPPLHPTRDILVEDVRRQTINTLPGENSKRNVNGSAHSQRTPSSSSFGSFDGNSVSLKSVNSGSLIDIVLEPEQSAVTHPTMTSLFPSFEQSSISASTASQDHPFNAIFVQPQATSSAPSIDLFADITHQHSATTPLEQKPSAVPSENEGWATFDLPHHATSVHEIKHEPPPIVPPGDGVPKGNLEALPSINNNMLWAAVQNSAAHGPFSSMANQWHGGTQVVQASTIPTSSQSWNAFDDSVGGLSQAFFENPPHRSEPHVPASLPVDQLMSSKISEGSSKDGFQRSIIEDRASVSSLPLNAVISGSSVLPLVGGTPSLHACDRKSTNPFDLPFESEMESSSMFLDMNSFKVALPNPQLSTTFLGGLTEPWFPQSSVTPYIPAVPQAYMAGQAPTSQLPNITAQGPVASLGGNPFA